MNKFARESVGVDAAKHNTARRRIQPSTVAMADPSPIVRLGLAGLVNELPGFCWVGGMSTQDEALRFCNRYGPDILIVNSTVDPNGQIAGIITQNRSSRSVIITVSPEHLNPQGLAQLSGPNTSALLHCQAELKSISAALRACGEGRRYVDPKLDRIIIGNTLPESREKSFLTTRELEILILISTGMSNRAVAEDLHVSIETVRTHMKNLLRKMECQRRAEAIAKGFHVGLLTPVKA